jgi:diaminopropionate ammonia-lyase
VSEDQVELAARDLHLRGVSSGPCGAASLAGLRAALLDVGGDRRRRQLGLNSSSTVVLLNTEGASDRTVAD